MVVSRELAKEVTAAESKKLAEQVAALEVPFLRATYNENLCRTSLHSNPDAPFLGTNVVDNGADREHASISEHFPSPHPAPKDDLRLLEEKLAVLKVAKRTKLCKANLRRTNYKLALQTICSAHHYECK